MIPFNVTVDEHNTHPKAGRYGVVISGGTFNGYPVTVVDNEKREQGGNRNASVLVLIHLADGVRMYDRLTPGVDMGYLFFHEALAEPTYRMYDYAKRELSEDEIIKTLKQVVYGIQPRLHSQTCLGWTSKKIEDDPNRYTGIFVLNDENRYKIQKTKGSVKFWKLLNEGDVEWNDKEDRLLFEEELDVDLYKKARKVAELRRQMVRFANEFLDKGEESLKEMQEYYTLKNELDEKLKMI